MWLFSRGGLFRELETMAKIPPSSIKIGFSKFKHNYGRNRENTPLRKNQQNDFAKFSTREKTPLQY